MRNSQFSIFKFQNQRGFTLLVALIFMSVMLAFGLALSSLSYKQQQLASSAVGSQYAFYAADAALECALQADQQQNLFAYDSNESAPAPLMTCDNASAFYPPLYPTGVKSHDTDHWVLAERLSFDSDTRCADVTVYKPARSGTTYIFSQGYDGSCATVANPDNARLTVRGIQTQYQSLAQITCSMPARTFPHTGSSATWEVPQGVYAVYVYARGAQGRGMGAGIGGRGAEVTGIIPVTPGEILTVNAGGQFGFNGGGSSAIDGGGSSDVRRGDYRQGEAALADRIIVAGGGGGSGWVNGAGGSAGYEGQNGTSAASSCPPNGGGGGGTQTAGGSGGQVGSGCTITSAGASGALWQGGSAGGTRSGGGGGGYYGGGGGSTFTEQGVTRYGGGGGGSSLVPADGSVTISSTGGHGSVTISCPPE